MEKIYVDEADYKVLIGYQYAGRKAANVLYVNWVEQYSTDPSSPMMDIAEHIAGLWTSQIMQVLTSTVVLEEVVVTSEFGFGTVTYPVGFTGVDSNAASPPQVAYLVKKDLISARRGGRMYLPGVRESQVNGDGFLEAGIAPVITEKCEAVRTGMSTGGGNYLKAKRLNPDGTFRDYRPIGSFTCDGRVATQRRRLR